MSFLITDLETRAKDHLSFASEVTLAALRSWNFQNQYDGSLVHDVCIY